MASTPKVTNYQPSEIPPWKIELIQRKKRYQGTMSPNSSNGNNGINNSHRSITQTESDVNTDKSLIDSTSRNGGSLVATKIHEYTAYSLKPITQIQHIASVISNGSNYNSSVTKQMDGALINSMEDGKISIAAGHSHFQQKTMNASTAAQPVTINANGSTQAMNNPNSHNSVTNASVALSNMEVEAPQPAQRKIIETKIHSTANQLNFRHGSDHIVADKEQFSPNTNIPLNDRKQDLVALTTTKCVVPNNKCMNINKSNNKYFQQSKTANEASNSNDIVSVSDASESKIIKNREPENWFPSKRNSLNLLAEQHQKLERELGRPKMVSAAFDESEDLQYGPGIVSKLRCRYLSLALRQTIKQRPTLDNLRRANSLSNLLDEEDEEHCDGDGINDQKSQNGGTGIYERISAQINDHNKTILANGDDNSINNTEYNSNKSILMPNNAITQPNENRKSFEKANESNGNDSRRQLQRGNDSLKRARSVEALMRYDTLAWRRDIIEDSEDYPSSNPIVLDEIIVSDYQSTVIKAKTAESITIEDKIQQARDRMNDMKPPRRLTSFMSDTERPPPDLVKQTLLKFEASANRRPRGNIQRYGNGDVAAKVATYKSKMSNDSLQSVTKLPPSGFMTQHKPMIKPRTTSPKPPAILNGLIKKPISFSNNGHENGKSIDVERMNQKNAFSSMRFDTKTYRNRTEIPSPQSSIESTSPMEIIDIPGHVYDMVRKRETSSTDFETPITQLSKKTEQLHLNARSLITDITFGLDETGTHSNTISDNDEVDDATSNSSEQGWSESYDVNVSDNDDNDFNHKFHVNKRNNINESNTKLNRLHCNQIKPTIISVPPVNLISNGSSSPFDRTPLESSNQPEPSVRQIGIIRPLMTESKPPPVPVARKPLVMAQKNEATISSDAIKVSVSAAPIVVSTQHSVVLPSTTSSVVVTNSVSVATANDIGNDVVVIECTGDSNIHANNTKPDNSSSFNDGLTPTKTNGICRTNSQYHSDSLPVNTISIDTRSIVHQKNLLNKEKSEEVLNNVGQTNSLTIQSPMKWNIKKSTILSSSSMSQASSTVIVNQSQSAQATQSVATKSRPSDIQTTNTMVFNFSDRKDVPDYIENDGLVIRRKRELPKPGESGFVLLGDLTVETSTDPEPDDTWICDPPSPCDVQFKNANVIVNGKSSLRDKSRSDPKQLSIRFNDVLTSTFEYPSEGSLCDEIGLTNRDAEFDVVDTDAMLYNNGHFLGNSPIASVPLGNYQPIKATIFNTNFELGVTRAHHPPPPPPAVKYQAPLPPPRTHSQNSKHSPSNGTSATELITSLPDNHHQQLISIDGKSANASTQPNGIESDSLQYLKPASDEQTVAWSEGASDLLF